MKINSLTNTTLSFLALLGLSLVAPACNGGSSDEGNEEVNSETANDTGTESGDATTTSDTGTTTTDTTGNDDPTVDTGTTETTETTGGDLPNGSSCTSDGECLSGNCYVVPFLGGQCGECNEDADCASTTMGGCTPPNPFMNNGSVCNMGEIGGGCETTDVCQDALFCGTVLDLLGLIQISTCGECTMDADCTDPGTICAPIVDVMAFSGINTCIQPMTLEQDSYCLLEGNGNDACMSGICSSVDIMGLAQIGACGECNTDADCMGGATCTPGAFDIGTASLTGSTCQ